MKKLSNINEDLFDSIFKKDANKEERKEDDINILGYDEFYDYIIKHYEFIDKHHPDIIKSNVGGIDFISLPFLKGNNNFYFRISARFKYDKIFEICSFSTLNGFKVLLRKLNNDFLIKQPNISEYFFMSKDGEVSNKICLNLIDKIIEYSDNPVLRKIS